MQRSGMAGIVVALAFAITLSAPSVAHAQDSISQAELIRKLLPTVVNITAHARAKPDSEPMTASSVDASDSFDYKSSAGSGFVVDPSGVIVTNWHVVAGAYEIFVTFADGGRLEAQVLNAARLIDLALLKVEAGKPLPAVTWADSSKVQIGDSVLAIGNPLGIGTSVSRGIVSALHRNISDTPYDDFIQTDAAINHGNSGGPLFNFKGEVIGVDSAIISPTAANAGLGFALPAYQAEFVIDQLKRYGWIRPGWLGLKIQDVNPDIARSIGMSPPRGSIVAWISDGGPAAKAGLQVGDVIVSFEEDTPPDERALLRDISGSAPGRVVKLGVVRNGQTIELTATLEEWPRMMWEEVNAPLKVAPPHWVIPNDLGIKVTELTDKLRSENDVPAGPKGALVTEVRRDTDAARRGLQPGDIIMRIGEVAVETPSDVLAQIEAARKTGRDMADFLVFPKDKGTSKFPSPKWLPLRVSAG